MKRDVIISALLGLALAAPLQAQSSSLGLGVGVVTPEGLDSSMWYTANLRLPLGSYLAIEPEVGYFKLSEEPSDPATTFEDLNYGANLLFVLPGDSLELFAGAGISAHRLKGGLGLAGVGGGAEESETRIGVQLLAGLELYLGESLGVFGAVRRDRLRETDLALEYTETKFYAGLRAGF